MSRNVWTFEETVTMLEIMEEKNCLQHFDGKKYRNGEIYNMIAQEMLAKGFEAKNVKQVEHRWKNLKSKYFITKKNNNRSGAVRETTNFFEHLDRMLGTRPATTTVCSGIDTSRAEESPSATDENVGNSSEASSTITEHPRKARNAKGKGSYEKCINVLSTKIEDMQKTLNDNFLNTQKELIKYEFELYSRQEAEYEKRHQAAMELNLTNFLKGIDGIVNPRREAASPKDNNNLSEFFQNWDAETE